MRYGPILQTIVPENHRFFKRKQGKEEIGRFVVADWGHAITGGKNRFGSCQNKAQCGFEKPSFEEKTRFQETAGTKRA